MINATKADSVRQVMRRWAILLVVVGVFALWATCRMRAAAVGLASPQGTITADAAAAEPAVEYWTCTMHPEVQQLEPGNCPICGMTLVPKYEGSDEPGRKPEALPAAQHAGHAASARQPKVWYMCTMAECNDKGSPTPGTRCPVCGMVREKIEMDAAAADTGDFEIALSERARRLAEVATQEVAYRSLFKQIHAVGKVTYDETRHKVAAAWVNGRIDKLFADFTGMFVTQGDHLVEIYSPELVAAQDELLNAMHGVDAIRGSPIESSRASAEQLVASARRNLELLGISDAQVDDIIKSGKASTHLTVHAPIGGTILVKNAMEGMYVKTGDTLYEIADLTHVWLQLDLYESDLPWIRPFQEVRVTAQSLPGEVFRGQIVFVDPMVDRMRRTIRVRVNVPNPHLKLKPEMFVDAKIRVTVGADGMAAAPGSPGAFACPMHPWETAETPATCPICTMNMVKADSIPGYAAKSGGTRVLSVPREAVLQTGERALVYIQKSPGVYRGVGVAVGPLAQDERGDEFYTILAGLEEGQSVVTRGNFAIDSQMQIVGKPSLFGAACPPMPEKAEAKTPAAMQDEPASKHHGLGHADKKMPMALETTTPAAEVSAEQPICPVMGNPVVPDVFTDFHGVRVYFCCPPCINRFIAEPAKYVPKLPPARQEKIKKALRREAEAAKRDADAARPATPAPEPAEAEKQTICPVMGNPIVPDVYTDFHGVRVYFCCPPCIKKFLDEPDKYVAKLPASMQAHIKAAMAKGGD